MSIKRTVHVNDRPYEITVENEHEETVLNESVKLLNSKIDEFSQVVIGRDRNDLLAMAALEIAADHVQNRKQGDFIKNDLNQRLQTIDQLLEEHTD